MKQVLVEEKDRFIITERDRKIRENFTGAIKSAKTEINYVHCVKKYCEFLKVNSYSQLLQGDLFDNIKSYILSLRSKKLSSGWIRIQIAALKLFYDMNDMDTIKWKHLKRYQGETTATHEDRAYSHEEIQRVLNISDVRLKAVIVLLCGSGLRIGALELLRLKDLHKREKDNVYKVVVYAGCPEKYITFTTPEAATVIDTYLEFRQRYGEKLNPESPLFRSQFDILEGIKMKVVPLSLSAHKKILFTYLQRAGLREVDSANKSNRKEVKMSHGFRKFFTNQLLESGVTTELRWLLEGHSLPGMDNHYVRATEEQLFLEYSKAISNLTINPENRLKRKVETLESKQDEIAMMKLTHDKEMNEMRQTMDKILTLVQENPKLAKVKKDVLKQI